MMRFLISAGCALALGATASAQTDTIAPAYPSEGEDFEQPAPAEFEEDFDTYEEDGDLGEGVDTADRRVLTPEQEPYVEDPDDPNGPDAIEPEDLNGPD